MAMDEGQFQQLLTVLTNISQNLSKMGEGEQTEGAEVDEVAKAQEGLLSKAGIKKGLPRAAKAGIGAAGTAGIAAAILEKIEKTVFPGLKTEVTTGAASAWEKTHKQPLASAKQYAKELAIAGVDPGERRKLVADYHKRMVTQGQRMQIAEQETMARHSMQPKFWNQFLYGGGAAATKNIKLMKKWTDQMFQNWALSGD